MDIFQKHKQDFLAKADKSKKGSIDKPIRKLVAALNALDYYYTTSCCSGRTVLLHKTLGNKKNRAHWLFSSHSLITKKQLFDAMGKIPASGEVWLLSEAPIMHIACKAKDDALRLIFCAKESGFKRASIISSNENKTTVEIFGNNRIEMPLAVKGKRIVPDMALPYLVKDCNAKMRRSHACLTAFLNSINSLRDFKK